MTNCSLSEISKVHFTQKCSTPNGNIKPNSNLLDHFSSPFQHLTKDSPTGFSQSNKQNQVGFEYK